MTLDGEVTNITIDHVKDDELDVILLVVENIKKWIESAKGINKKDAKEYKPLRVTVRGAAGSGKSFFIKALANTVREMFGDQNAVHISAPTGAAAHNVGGETIHRKFQVNPHRPENDIVGKEAKARLKETKRRTVVEIIDERSMLTCKVVGAAERHTAEAAHGGSHANEDWGGMPVVVFVGDDYQLPPPTNVEKGAFDLMDSKTSFSQQKLGDASFGSQLLMNMSEKCVELRRSPPAPVKLR